jgi:hypothetical protein
MLAARAGREPRGEQPGFAGYSMVRPVSRPSAKGLVDFGALGAEVAGLVGEVVECDVELGLVDAR